jgi:hypothetical protein
MSIAQTMSGAVKRIDPSRGTAVAHTSLFVIDIPSVSRSGNQPRKHQMGEKGLEWGIPAKPQ